MPFPTEFSLKMVEEMSEWRDGLVNSLPSTAPFHGPWVPHHHAPCCQTLPRGSLYSQLVPVGRWGMLELESLTGPRACDLTKFATLGKEGDRVDLTVEPVLSVWAGLQHPVHD